MDPLPPSSSGLTYAEAGVDIDAGDRAVAMMQAALRRTHGPRVMGPMGGFAGLFRLDFNEKLFQRNYRDPVLAACTDGVGTKVKLAADLQAYDTLGIDCVAMNVNDLVVQGAEPLFFLDYLGLHKQDPEITSRIVSGVARGCEIAGCALIGGECAEMPDIYAEGDFDIAGFAVGVVELDRATDPLRVQAEDVLIGLSSSGVHSNGYSLVRRIIDHASLDLSQCYDTFKGHDDRPLGDILLEPTRIYSPTIVNVLSHYRVKKVVSTMAHITGGGLPGNLNRMLPDDMDAMIDTTSWNVPPIFEFLQHHGAIEPEEMFRVFNMGIGFVLAVRPSFADSVLRQVQKLGERAAIIGEITSGNGEVHLKGRSSRSATRKPS
ncbi:MAG: phosphoribosylformylglycinamidine cyclo-ligase [Planctomycetota bacterium]|nr:phosphoribosylformylglycinamidine cyclo-ligase [Planctomycetota bacterium]